MNHNQSLSQEDILIALDQLDQTVEVMSNIIRRLKHSLDDTLSSPNTNSTDSDQEQNALASLSSVNVSFDTNLH